MPNKIAASQVLKNKNYTFAALIIVLIVIPEKISFEKYIFDAILYLHLMNLYT
jgi:hypothetical protein